MAEREGTAAAAPKRSRRDEACCLSPAAGELHASSAGADKLRSSAQLATARRRHAPARTRGHVVIDTGWPAGDDAGHAQALLGLPETVRLRRGARGAPVDARVAPGDGLRVGALPEPRRVFRFGDGDFSDPRRGLHAPLRLLRDRQGGARAAGPGRAGGGRRGCATPRAGLCRRDVRDSRRSRGRRCGTVCRDDPRDSRRQPAAAATRGIRWFRGSSIPWKRRRGFGSLPGANWRG